MPLSIAALCTKYHYPEWRYTECHDLLIVMLNVFMQVSRFTYCYAECVYAECRYAQCHYAECRYAECRYAECRYAECHYAECRYAKCHGAN